MTSLADSLGVVVAVTVLLTLALTLLVLRWLRRRGGARGRSRGLAGERRARRVLERAGYRVLEQGVEGRAHVVVDGRRLETPLHVDYLVERSGERFLVEVKTGARRRATIDTTRRQLLEYCLAFGVDVVLLVDAEEGHIQRVSFDYRVEAP